MTEDKIAAEHRDERQDQVRDWVVQCWGENAVSVNERVERFFEEAAELAQAEGIPGGGVRSSLEAVVRAIRGGSERETLEGVLLVAEGELKSDRLGRIVEQVYRKSPGDPAQEVGGIGTTLLAYCAAKGISADDCERRELTRILGKPVDHFRARHAAKVQSGLAQALAPAPPSTAPDKSGA